MTGLVICAITFSIAYLSGRRSPVGGLIAVLAVGYFYGILRANFLSGPTYFAFDTAVAGYYLTFPWSRLGEYRDHLRTRQLETWLTLLIGWPLLLLLVPIQDPLVQLVGLRANVFLLPFLLVGARLTAADLDGLAVGLAGLNVVALAFAIGEVLLGVPAFFPYSPVTELMYRTMDVTVGFSLRGLFRIPSTFPNASAYGATMAITLPVLLGAWVQRKPHRWQSWLLSAGLAGAILGVFLAASRTHMMVLLVLVPLSLFSRHVRAPVRAVWLVMVAGLGWIVVTNERMVSRLTTITFEAVVDRIGISVNRGFISYMTEYPLGNGLGGGGSNMPHFIQQLVRNPVSIENQYATFMLELGVPGMLLWIAFIAWALTRFTANDPGNRWHLGRRLAWWACAAYYANGLIGIGFLTSVPFSVLLLVSTGWLVAPFRAAPTAQWERRVDRESSEDVLSPAHA